MLRWLNRLSQGMFVVVIGVVLLGGCSSDDEDIVNPEEPVNPPDDRVSTFQAIQTYVFESSCANSACHAVPTVAGGLDLTDEVAYTNLVNVKPQNPTAAAEGMLRVQPNRPENSFLLTKLMGPEHDEGQRMPRDGGKLHPDKIEAIRKWIAAGAPQKTVVDGIPDISNLIDLPPETFSPPPLPRDGVQLHLPAFEIAPGTEKEVFYALRLPVDEDIFVNRIEIYYPEGSHHFILYQLTKAQPLSTVRELDPNNPVHLLDGHEFIVGTQTAETLYEFPEGVALRFGHDTVYDMNSHFVNLSGTDPLQGEAYVNLYTIPKEQVEHVATSLFLPNFNIRVPPGETRTTKLTWLTREPIHLFMLSSHMHRHGDNFQIMRLNGELLHESFAYDDPPTDLFNPPIRLEAGDGLTFQCTHTNHDKDRPIVFGLTSEDEMCIALGYYF